MSGPTPAQTAAELLDALDARQRPSPATQRRHWQRSRWRGELAMTIQTAGSAWASRLWARDISAGGMGGLHQGDLPLNARVVVHATERRGPAHNLPATVVRSEDVGGGWYLLGLMFDHRVDPLLFL